MCVDTRSVRLETVIPGDCRGRLIVLNRYISFFGEVDPETGCMRGEPVCLENVVLVFKGTRGSTVAPYIIYALKKNEKSPICMIVEEVEPMLVVGCVLAEIPLYRVKDFSMLMSFHNSYVEVANGELRICKP